MRKRILALVLAALMLTGTAHAAIVPELETLLALYGQGDTLKLSLNADISQWQAVSPQTLPALQAVLAGMRADLVLSRDATVASLFNQDAALASVRLDSLADGREAMTITPGGLGYIAAAGEMVTGFLTEGASSYGPMNAAEWLSILNGARQTLPDLLSPLEGYGTLVKRSITIKNVGTARSQVAYTLSAEEWNALWPFMLHQMEQSVPFAQSVGTTLHERVLAFLNTLTFESECTLKRYLDAEGADMGWQFTGRVGRIGEAVRKVTLYGGVNDATGLYLSMKLPAVSGGENLSMQASFTWKERNGTTTIAGDFDLRTVFGPDSVTEHIKADLKRAGDQPRLTGRIVWDSATGGTKKWKSALTLKPDFALNENAIDGTLAVEAKVQGSPAFEGVISAMLAPAAMPDPPLALRTVDLTQLTEEQIAKERETLAGLLMMPLWMYANRLPASQRASLLHDLGRDERTNGATVPVMDLPDLVLPDAAPADDYVVDMEELP